MEKKIEKKYCKNCDKLKNLDEFDNIQNSNELYETCTHCRQTIKKYIENKKTSNVEGKQFCNGCKGFKNVDDFHMIPGTTKKYKICYKCVERNEKKKENPKEIQIIEGKTFCKRCKKYRNLDEFSINIKTNEQYANCDICREHDKEYDEDEDNHNKKIERRKKIL